MKYKKFSNFYVLRLSKGENLQESLKSFCQNYAKNGGYFLGIGAADKVILAHYDVKLKRYSQKEFKKPLEITSITGNVCFFDEEVVAHTHVVLADKNMKVLSGHLIEAKISGTCEIIFFPFDEKITKFFDDETGLKLMDI